MNEQISLSGCELEKRIYEYKLRSLQAHNSKGYIIEVNEKTVCLKGDLPVLSNDPFPTEFDSIETSVIKQKIVGATPIVYRVREWYEKQMRLLIPKARIMQVINAERSIA